MKIKVYGINNHTRDFINYVNKKGYIVEDCGIEKEGALCDLEKTLSMDNIKKHCNEKAIHFFIGFESSYSLFNSILTNIKFNGLIAIYLTGGWNTFKKIEKNNKFNLIDIIFCNNQVYVDILEKKGIKSYYFPNSLNTNKIKFIGYNKSVDYTLLTYSLKYSYAKNYPGLIKFFNKLYKQDSRFRLIIKAQSLPREIFKDEENKVLSLISKYNLENVISRFNEEINKDKKWRINFGDANYILPYTSSTICYSKWESFGFFIAESLLAGKMVFVKGWDNPLKPEQFWGKYVCYSKEEMLDKIINYYSLNEKEKKKISIENREYVINNFDCKIQGDLFIDIIKEFI